MSGGDRLVIRLEDAAVRSRWVSRLRLVPPVSQWHFVAVIEGRARYQSPVFQVAAGQQVQGDASTSTQQWAPEMSEALEDLLACIAADGWTEVSRGIRPWEHVYRRAS